jgi:plastocyanin
VVLGLVLLAAASCGTSKDNDVAAGIGIQNSSYAPDPYIATQGDTITVVNLDSIVHTLTADDGSFSTGRIPSREHKTIEVSKPGLISYHCEIHGFMRGAVRVAEQP